MREKKQKNVSEKHQEQLTERSRTSGAEANLYSKYAK